MEVLVKKIVKNPFEEAQNLEVKDLEKVIKYTRDKFFNDESVISDNIYDLLVDVLTYKDPKNKILKEVGAKVKSKNKVKLDYHLGSMDKIKPPSNKIYYNKLILSSTKIILDAYNVIFSQIISNLNFQKFDILGGCIFHSMKFFNWNINLRI